ncbi:MAG: hypothetical protein CMP76_04485 [Flavobacterium sp.]|nr:hypothetical protein [Flavobacterium sp.]
MIKFTLANWFQMKKYLLYFILIYLFSFLLNKSENNITNQNQFVPSHQDQYHFTSKSTLTSLLVENPNFFIEEVNEIFVESKVDTPFLNYFTTSIVNKELFFSFLNTLNEKNQNHNLVAFSKFQIIFPFHSFW